MNAQRLRQTLVVFAILALLMAVTRYDHVGSPIRLPDASTAVFFLAGFYLTNPLALPALLGLAGLLDYLAIGVGAVSDWCVTPAYGFLIPTYASLWWGGRWYARRARMAWRRMTLFAAVLLAATTVGFLISNISFYALSGYFSQMSAAQYGEAAGRYYPPYLGWTVFYVAGAVIAQLAATALGSFAVARAQR